MKNINAIKKYGSGIRTDIYIFQYSYNKIYPLNFKYLRFISFDFNIRYQLRSKKLSLLNNLTLHSVTQRKSQLSVTLTPMQPIFGQSLNTEERLPHGQGQPRFQGLSSSRSPP